MGESLQVHLLGPLQVRRQGRPVPVPSSRQRALVARLALEAGRVVGTDRLIDVVWADRPPADAHGALHHHVSRLRRAIGAALVTRGPGYLLDVRDDDVDALQFTRLAAAGRAALRAGSLDEAGSALRAALALWRGPPLEEFLDRDWARPPAARLQGQYLDAVEDGFDVDLATGRHADVLEPIREVLAEHPFRERLWGQLMVALYRCGRQPDALSAYADARRILADEHGLDPGPQLADLEHAILSHDPQLAAPRPRFRATGGSGNLPAPLTSFVGRAEELLAVQRLVKQARLVTLTGPPGVGKTRLAVEVARALHPDVEDGVWMVELASLTQGGEVTTTLAAALGVRPGGAGGAETPLVDRVVQHLRSRSALVVVDNCEHLLGEVADLVHTLLAGCPRLGLLATSRESLGVPGEALWPVEGLSVPDPARHDPAALLGTEALRLFEDRAAQVRPSFVITTEAAPAVAELCHRLDGLPLAIELAAARVTVLPVARITAGLADRFRLLVTGSRTAPPRHQTLRAAVEWSYDLLGKDERRLFQQLAVFPSGCSLPTAESIGARLGLGAYSTLDLLSGLTGKSLVVASTGVDGEPRYRMLETLREYGIERLRAEGGYDAARRRHAELFASFAESGEAGLYGSDSSGWLRRLDQDRENLRAALRWAVAAGRGDLALCVAGALGFFFAVSERHDEGRDWLDAALAVPDTGTSAVVLARAVSYRGFLRTQQGDAAGSVADAERGLELAHRAGDRWQIAQSTAILALALGETGPPDRVAALLAQARAAYRDVADPRGDWGLASCALAAARSAMRAGDVALAEHEAQEILRPARRLGYDLFEAWGRLLLAWAAGRRGDTGAAVAECRAALRLVRGVGLPHYVSFVLAVLGRYVMLDGDLGAARKLQHEAVDLVDATVSPWFAAFAHEGLAATVHRRGGLATAESLYRRVLAESPPEGSTFAQQAFYVLLGGSPVARALIGLSVIAVSHGSGTEAGDLAVDGIHRAHRDADQVAVAVGLEVLAAAVAAGGDPDRAAELLGAAAAHRDAAGLTADAHDAAAAERTAASVRRALGDRAAALAFQRGWGRSRDVALAELTVARPASRAADDSVVRRGPGASGGLDLVEPVDQRGERVLGP
ncbi:AAA family ATPase [Geodermatophilus sp. YIM 151500]|uniref:BTAD domain-containing putative transcriptional regulator n=1 Tax=Geodermatophilus sp. YIM 151500 TaxID=2984531 RepID=UPI0021E3DB96|nr:BTAD domain-containing putative transcriptional regulator [Geodermatophilus sp. YIM 151500]MCV2488001.1 AAA family ATPase [Geodermatophilus sp. YIM 151500]